MSEFSPVVHTLFDATPFVLASLTDAGGLLTLRLEGSGGRKYQHTLRWTLRLPTSKSEIMLTWRNLGYLHDE